METHNNYNTIEPFNLTKLTSNQEVTPMNLNNNTVIRHGKLIAIAEALRAAKNLGLLPITTDPEPVILYTDAGLEIALHWWTATKSYTFCNGPNCIFDKLGRKNQLKFHLPVFRVLTGDIAILAISESMRPLALRPQIQNILSSGKRQGVFISRDGYDYNVDPFDITSDMDSGEEVIKNFLAAHPDGDFDVSGLYRQVSNEEMADIPEIANLMKIKGIVL